MAAFRCGKQLAKGLQLLLAAVLKREREDAAAGHQGCIQID